jgi:predicted RNase H-like nuclease
MAKSRPEYAGIDGCKAGWVYVAMNEAGGYGFGIEAKIGDVVRKLHGADLILVDMPIGLPSARCPKRHCDVAARSAIAPRGSSVFPVPARCALVQLDYAAACAENERVLGKRLSKQSWAIAPKIREVDDFLRKGGEKVPIREMHPEVAFWALNFETPLVEKKKKTAGIRERLDILCRHYPLAEACYEACLQSYASSEVAKDDILDALVGAVTARYAPNLATFPANPVFDEEGLPMEIVYAVPSNGPVKAPAPYYPEMESAAAELVGRILFALTRLEFNLALALRYAHGNPGDEAFELWSDKLNFKDKLEKLKSIVETRFGAKPELKSEFAAWYENMERVRKKRNAFVHGRWGISHTHRRIQHVSDDYPGVGEKGVTTFSLGSLRSELDDIERLEKEFSQLRRKFNSFWSE